MSHFDVSVVVEFLCPHKITYITDGSLEFNGFINGQLVDIYFRVLIYIPKMSGKVAQGF